MYFDKLLETKMLIGTIIGVSLSVLLGILNNKVHKTLGPIKLNIWVYIVTALLSPLLSSYIMLRDFEYYTYDFIGVMFYGVVALTGGPFMNMGLFGYLEIRNAIYTYKNKIH